MKKSAFHIAYSDERWLYYQFSRLHLYISLGRNRENVFFELGRERVKDAPSMISHRGFGNHWKMLLDSKNWVSYPALGTVFHFANWSQGLIIICELVSSQKLMIYRIFQKYLSWPSFNGTSSDNFRRSATTKQSIFREAGWCHDPTHCKQSTRWPENHKTQLTDKKKIKCELSFENSISGHTVCQERERNLMSVILLCCGRTSCFSDLYFPYGLSMVFVSRGVLPVPDKG